MLEESMKNTMERIPTQTGQQVGFEIKDNHSRCKEFVLSYQPFSFRRWFFWSIILNGLGFLFKLHTQDSRMMSVALVIVALALLVKINIKVHKESLLVSPAVGVQLTTTFISGRQKSVHYDVIDVENILINEGIKMHQVLFYLVLVLNDHKKRGIAKLVPLFTHCWPSVVCLRKIYMGVQELIKPES